MATRMSETDHPNEPHVSPESCAPPSSRAERSAAIPYSSTSTRKWRRRRSGSSAKRSSPRTHDGSTLRTELDAIRRSIDASRADQIELRAALDAARGDAAELRAELATTKAESRERRNALEKLANAGLFKRRKVLADLQGRGSSS